MLEGAGKIDEQNHPIAVRIVPHFVIVAIIKNENLSFRPIVEQGYSIDDSTPNLLW